MPILEELLAPVTKAEFVEQYLRQQPFAAPFRANKWKGFLNTLFVQEILATNHSNCWLPKFGKLPTDPHLNTGRLSFSQVSEGWQQGRTFLVRHAEMAHPKIQEIAEDFVRSIPGPIDVQIYYTPGGEEGFGWHFDSEEVFVIQSVGEKEFYLRANENSKNVISCHLKAGDWLYIPSGYLHKAKAKTHSAHLSIGVLL